MNRLMTRVRSSSVVGPASPNSSSSQSEEPQKKKAEKGEHTSSKGKLQRASSKGNVRDTLLDARVVHSGGNKDLLERSDTVVENTSTDELTRPMLDPNLIQRPAPTSPKMLPTTPRARSSSLSMSQLSLDNDSVANNDDDREKKNFLSSSGKRKFNTGGSSLSSVVDVSITNFLNLLAISPELLRPSKLLDGINKLKDACGNFVDERVPVDHKIQSTVDAYLEDLLSRNEIETLSDIANVSSKTLSTIPRPIALSILISLINIFENPNLGIDTEKCETILIKLHYQHSCFESIFQDSKLRESLPPVLLGFGAYGTTYRLAYTFLPDELKEFRTKYPGVHSGYYVFKPDSEGEVNIQGAAQRIGISGTNPLFAQRALASFALYRLLCEQSECWKLLNVVGTYPAVHDGKTGIIMEFAQGVSAFANGIYTLGSVIPTNPNDPTGAFNLNELNKAMWDEKGNPTDLAAYKELLQLFPCDRIIKDIATGTYYKAYKPYINPNFNDPVIRRTYILMTLFDLMGQQVDRNPGNKFIRCDIRTQAVKGFSLFDQDLSFGSMNIDISDLGPRDFTDGGVFMTGYPPVVDSEMLESLQQLDLAKVSDALKNLLPREEINRTLERVQKLKEHYALEKQVHTNIRSDEWGNDNVTTLLDCEDSIQKKSSQHVHFSYLQRESEMCNNFSKNGPHAVIALDTYLELQKRSAALKPTLNASQFSATSSGSLSDLAETFTADAGPFTEFCKWLKTDSKISTSPQTRIAVDTGNGIQIL